MTTPGYDGRRADPALAIAGLTKSFGGQPVLSGVDLEVRAGEVHALLGENGAGKSTLIKALAGVHRADAGTITVEGSVLPAGHGPADAAGRGLRFVHQDLALIDDLSVAENIAVDVGYAGRGRLVSMRRTRERAAALLARQGVAVDVRRPVGDLPQAEKVMVAIARAFHGEARVIVLDEVSASLPLPEVERLQRAVRHAATTGTGFVWVTHRLDELEGFADRLTVLRDGRHVATATVDEVGLGQVVTWIVGRAVDTGRTGGAREPDPAARVLLDVAGLLGPGLAEPLGFRVAAGEVLGLTGLLGSGVQQVARLLGGSPTVRAGSATLAGAALPLGDMRGMRLAGCTYVPGDRAADGLLTGLTVRENLFPARIGAGEDDRRWRDPRHERRAAARLVEAFRVRPSHAVEMPVDTLSGGNQQKVVFARALRTAPRMLVLADPTAGVDIGARAELYALMHRAAAEGAAVVLATSDFNEIVQQADRAMVMVRGRVGGELAGAQLTRDAIAAMSYGAAAREAA